MRFNLIFNKKTDMKNNRELTELMALDLGLNLDTNRRPLAKDVFKWQDMDLLPHSSADTLLCEIFEWNGRNWRTTNNNLIGYIFPGEEIAAVKKQLQEVPKFPAMVPDFEFSKENLTEFGFSLPSLFNIGINGNINSAKNFSIRVNNVTKSRITNIDAPGIEILKRFSAFTENESKTFRRNIKFNYLSTSLFYAETVEIILEKDAGVALDVHFDTANVDVDTKIDTQTQKHLVLKYTGNQAPFAAKFTKGKDFDLK